MGTNRRNFLRNTVVGAGLLSSGKAWAGTEAGLAGEKPGNPQQAAEGGTSPLAKPATRYPYEPLGRARIQPTLVKLQPGAKQQFRAIIDAPAFSYAHVAEKARWTVNGIEGGDARVGTISASGLYQAPVHAPVPHEVHVCAEVEGVMNRFLFATALVGTHEAAYTRKSSWTDKEHRIKFAHGITLDSKGNLLIADSVGNKVFRYSPDGRLLTEFGAGSRGQQPPRTGSSSPRTDISHQGSVMGYFGGMLPGYFSGPRIAVEGPSGMVYVVDTEERRPEIQVFDGAGRFQFAFGYHGVLPGYLIRVHGMAFDSKGRLHTEDVENCRINTYDTDGKFLSSWGREGALPGDLNAPHCIYIDPNDEIFILGYYGPTQKFTADGHFLLSFAHADPPSHPVSFQSVCGDSWGNVYIPMREEGLAKFTNTGDFVGWVNRGTAVQWATVSPDGTVYAVPINLSNGKHKPLPTVEIYSEL